MSHHQKPVRKPAFADWQVREVITGNLALITGARFTRDEHGGYTFTDEIGVCADFPPGTVLHVMRHEPLVLEDPAPGQVAEFQEALNARAPKLGVATADVRKDARTDGAFA